MDFIVYRYKDNNGREHTLDVKHTGNPKPVGTFTTVEGEIAELFDDRLIGKKILLIGDDAVTADMIVSGKAGQLGYGVYTPMKSPVRAFFMLLLNGFKKTLLLTRKGFSFIVP